MIGDAERRLHEIAHRALFTDDGWPASRETVKESWQLAISFGLAERLDNRSIRFTDKGQAVGIELTLSLIGAIDEWDVPMILEERGYISEQEAETVYCAPSESQALQILRSFVTKSYMKLLNTTEAIQ